MARRHRQDRPAAIRRTASPRAPRRSTRAPHPARRRGARSAAARPRRAHAEAGPWTAHPSPEAVGLLERFTAGLTAGDGQAAAACFEYPALMVMSGVGPYGGSQPLSDAREVAPFFDKAPDQYHAKGVRETFPDVQGALRLAHDLELVAVRFPYLDADGNDLGDGETSVYLVRKAVDGARICVAITLGTDGDRAARDAAAF